MKYYLAIDGWNRPRGSKEPLSLISGEQYAIDAAYASFYRNPKIKRIDVMRVTNTENPIPGEQTMSLFRRAGKTDPAVQIADEVSEPAR